ncbi:MAG: hypothetical protein ACJ77K_11075 [Bacteroidia bacterium]
MLHKINKLLIFLFAYVGSAKAQPTFTEQIAPILYNKCASCHHEGGIAPLQFTSYAEIKKHAGMIVMAALDPKSKFMPPWMPDPGYSHFADERILTGAEMKSIRAWIDNGMPEGPKAAEPMLPAYKNGSQLGTPDLTVSMKEAFHHKGGNLDEYHVFVLPTGLKEGHQISAIEIVPGNPKIAHHIILGLDTTQFADKLDAKDASYGYEQYSGFGFYPTYDNWSGWVPGQKTRFFPDGIGNYILPNSKVLLQMHYGPSPLESWDSTTVNIFYSKTPVKRFLKGWVLSPNDIKDGPFFIKANTTQTFHAQYKVVDDCSLISITPHAHWLGKKWEVFAVHPNGDTTHLIRIDDWDFNWQNFFNFQKLIKLEKGTIMYCNVTYDNTEKNFRNPNRPLKNVAWGESAKDEMFLFYFAYVDYRPGDEDIIIGGQPDSLYTAYAPDIKKVKISYNLSSRTNVSLQLFDSNNKAVDRQDRKEEESGPHAASFDAARLKPGTYWCKIATAAYTESQKIIIE